LCNNGPRALTGNDDASNGAPNPSLNRFLASSTTFPLDNGGRYGGTKIWGPANRIEETIG